MEYDPRRKRDTSGLDPEDIFERTIIPGIKLPIPMPVPPGLSNWPGPGDDPTYAEQDTALDADMPVSAGTNGQPQSPANGSGKKKSFGKKLIILFSAVLIVVLIIAAVSIVRTILHNLKRAEYQAARQDYIDHVNEEYPGYFEQEMAQSSCQDILQRMTIQTSSTFKQDEIAFFYLAEDNIHIKIYLDNSF